VDGASRRLLPIVDTIKEDYRAPRADRCLEC